MGFMCRYIRVHRTLYEDRWGGVVVRSSAIYRYETCRGPILGGNLLLQLRGQLNMIHGLTLFENRHRIKVIAKHTIRHSRLGERLLRWLIRSVTWHIARRIDWPMLRIRTLPLQSATLILLLHISSPSMPLGKNKKNLHARTY